MTKENLFFRLASPPPGSKLRVPQDYGLDLTLYLHSLLLTPEDRFRELQSAQVLLEELRCSAKAGARQIEVSNPKP